MCDAPALALQDAIDLFEDKNDAVFQINRVLADEGKPRIARQTLDNWLRLGQVPAERARVIELATGGAVKREELRPDLYE
jgi:hypothetical protein